MGVVCIALQPRNTPEQLPAPRLMSQCLPRLPSPFSLHTQAISPTSVSHFPRAPSDKFIKLRDDTVNGHMKIKKKEKEGRWGGGGGGGSLEPPLMLQGEFCTPKVMRVGEERQPHSLPSLDS